MGQCICEGGMVSWHRRENKKRKYLVQCVRQRMRWPGGETWDDERAGELRRRDGGEGTRVARGWQQPPWVSESSGEDEREGGCEGAHGNMARTREARATREKISSMNNRGPSKKNNSPSQLVIWPRGAS
jgi:hypothetical protein